MKNPNSNFFLWVYKYLVFREEHKLRVFKYTIMRIFGFKNNKVTEGWKKLHHNE